MIERSGENWTLNCGDWSPSIAVIEPASSEVRKAKGKSVPFGFACAIPKKKKKNKKKKERR